MLKLNDGIIIRDLLKKYEILKEEINEGHKVGAGSRLFEDLLSLNLITSELIEMIEE